MPQNHQQVLGLLVQYLIVCNILATCTSSLTLVQSTPRQIRAVNGHQEMTPAAQDCLNVTGNIRECLEDLKEAQLSPKVINCLNGCADCVKQWRVGVYNGRSCANDCIQQSYEENPPESLDPDCNLVRYFNSTVLANLKRK